MIIREANLDDWDELKSFYCDIYRLDHPLCNKEFWDWQFGNPKFGRSFISVDKTGKIVGHVGANFAGEISWIINVYLKEECRGKGILGELYKLARAYYPLAATAANAAGLGLYRNMRWIRYHDLVRYVKINPMIIKPDISSVCKMVDINYEFIEDAKQSHYFRQPGIRGLSLDDGSKAICQSEVGGLRIVDIECPIQIEEQAWRLGYLWVDYITSWNDLRIKELESKDWLLDKQTVVPWRLNPIIENYFCDISYLSEKPLDNDFIVHRSYSDHGRIGSL